MKRIDSPLFTSRADRHCAGTGEYWIGIRQLCLQVLATISWHSDTGMRLVDAGMLPVSASSCRVSWFGSTLRRPANPMLRSEPQIAINALEDEDDVTVGRAIGILNNIAMYEQVVRRPPPLCVCASTSVRLFPK